MKKIAEKTRDQIDLICDMETHRPFTMSRGRIVSARDESMMSLVHHRNDTNPSARISRTSHTTRDRNGVYNHISQDQITDDVLIGHLSSKGVHISDIKQLARLHGPDEYEDELMVISKVHAYFAVATERMVDIVPMIFEVVFARDFGRELRKVLAQDLNLTGEKGVENCARYTEDAKDVHLQRVKLTEDKSILFKALQILRTS